MLLGLAVVGLGIDEAANIFTITGWVMFIVSIILGVIGIIKKRNRVAAILALLIIAIQLIPAFLYFT